MQFIGVSNVRISWANGYMTNRVTFVMVRTPKVRGVVVTNLVRGRRQKREWNYIEMLLWQPRLLLSILVLVSAVMILSRTVLAKNRHTIPLPPAAVSKIGLIACCWTTSSMTLTRAVVFVNVLSSIVKKRHADLETLIVRAYRLGTNRLIMRFTSMVRTLKRNNGSVTWTSPPLHSRSEWAA